jgi:parvulin-like peptidyl-prolyl isomerase
VLFGDDIAAALFSLPPDTWTGPYRSDFGLHLVRLRKRTEARLPPYDEIAEKVAAEFAATRRREANEAAYREMRAHYDIVIEAPADALAASP